MANNGPERCASSLGNILTGVPSLESLSLTVISFIRLLNMLPLQRTIFRSWVSQSASSELFPHNDIFPSSSPQGDRVAFSSDRPYPDICCLDLFLMRADGSGLHRVPTGLVGVMEPDWGPAPRDDAAATATAAARQAAPARTGTSAATLCAWRPELRLLGRCGPPQQILTK